MIGERLESHRGFSPGAPVLLAVGLGLAVAGLAWGIEGMLVGAALPIAIAGSLWFLGQDRPLTATFREDGLEVESRGEPVLVPYATIRNLRVGGRPADPAGFRRPSCPIEVLHEGGLLRIPAHLNFPSDEVLRFLADRVPDGGGRDVNPVLADYLQRQEMYFGPESVATFRGAGRPPTGSRSGLRAVCIGLMLAGAAWAALGFSGAVDVGWGAAGITCLLLGALLVAATFAESMPAHPAMKAKVRKGASLVIGPIGMAMVQGDIQGEVRWPELLEIRLQAKPSGLHLAGAGAFPGILLRVKGADILIADIYDRPLYVIYNRIMSSAGRAAPLDAEL